MLHKKLISILGCVFLVMICGCADNRIAAVKQNGAWYFIDRNGDPASDAIQMDDQEDAKENLKYLFNNLYADRPGIWWVLDYINLRIDYIISGNA